MKESLKSFKLYNIMSEICRTNTYTSQTFIPNFICKVSIISTTLSKRPMSVWLLLWGKQNKREHPAGNRFKCIYYLQLLEMLDKNRFNQMIVSLKSCSLGNATFMELTSNNVQSSQLSQLDFIIWALLLSPYLFGLWICQTPCAS